MIGTTEQQAAERAAHAAAGLDALAGDLPAVPWDDPAVNGSPAAAPRGWGWRSIRTSERSRADVDRDIAAVERAIEMRRKRQGSVAVRTGRTASPEPGIIGATFTLRGGMRGARTIHWRRAQDRAIGSPLAARAARWLALAERHGRADWHDRAAQLAQGIGLAHAIGPNVAAAIAERDARARLAGIAAHLAGLEHDRQRREDRQAREVARAAAAGAYRRVADQRAKRAAILAERARLAGDAIEAERLAERARDIADTLAEADADLADARAAAAFARDLADGARHRLAEVRAAQTREAARLAVAEAQLAGLRREQRAAQRSLRAMIGTRPHSPADHQVKAPERWVKPSTAARFGTSERAVRPQGATVQQKPIKHRARRRKVTSETGARISARPATPGCTALATTGSEATRRMVDRGERWDV